MFLVELALKAFIFYIIVLTIIVIFEKYSAFEKEMFKNHEKSVKEKKLKKEKQDFLSKFEILKIEKSDKKNNYLVYIKLLKNNKEEIITFINDSSISINVCFFVDHELISVMSENEKEWFTQLIRNYVDDIQREKFREKREKYF